MRQRANVTSIEFDTLAPGMAQLEAISVQSQSSIRTAPWQPLIASVSLPRSPRMTTDWPARTLLMPAPETETVRKDAVAPSATIAIDLALTWNDRYVPARTKTMSPSTAASIA